MQAVKDHGSQQAAQIPEMPEAAVTVGPWSIKADWQPFSHKWQSDLRATLPPLGEPHLSGPIPACMLHGLWTMRTMSFMVMPAIINGFGKQKRSKRPANAELSWLSLYR